MFLPKYSPEFNPCELVFQVMKQHLRYWRGFETFVNEILKSAAHITYYDMIAFYAKCNPSKM